jgi:hypothetical protein
MLNTFIRRLRRSAPVIGAPYLLLLLAFVALGTTTPARGGEVVVLGELLCHLTNADDDGTVTAVGTWQIVCVYQPTDGGIDESYIGTLGVIDLDDRLGDQRVFAWAVRGPIAASNRPGLLAQNYLVGGEGEASSLIGAAENSINLISIAPGGSSSALAPFIEDMWLELQAAPA